MIPKRPTRSTRTDARVTEAVPSRSTDALPSRAVDPMPARAPRRAAPAPVVAADGKKADQRVGVLQRQLAAMAQLNLPSDDGSPDRTP